MGVCVHSDEASRSMKAGSFLKKLNINFQERLSAVWGIVGDKEDSLYAVYCVFWQSQGYQLLNCVTISQNCPQA